MTEAAPEGPRFPWRSHPLWRRLPLLAVAVIGLTYLMPQAPREVEIDYSFGSFGRSATRLEIELRNARGVGVRRSEVSLAPGARRYTQHLRLERGPYQVTLTFGGPGERERAVRDLAVGDDDVIEVQLGSGRTGDPG